MSDHLKISKLAVTTGKNVTPQVSFQLKINGEEKPVFVSRDENPKWIIIKEILKIVDSAAKIENFSAGHFQENGAFRGRASISLEKGGKSISIEAFDYDENTATAEALITALNGLQRKPAKRNHLTAI